MLLFNAKRHLHGSIIPIQAGGRLNVVMHELLTVFAGDNFNRQRERTMEPEKSGNTSNARKKPRVC